MLVYAHGMFTRLNAKAVMCHLKSADNEAYHDLYSHLL